MLALCDILSYTINKQRNGVINMIKYKNPHTNECKSYEDWYLWTVNFFIDIDPLQEFVSMPSDWWIRLVRRLNLEKVEV